MARPMVDTRKVCRMQMAVGAGYVVIELPWDLTDDEWQDVADIVAVMKRSCQRARDKRADSTTETTTQT